jgi:hypothetical protein
MMGVSKQAFHRAIHRRAGRREVQVSGADHLTDEFAIRTSLDFWLDPAEPARSTSLAAERAGLALSGGHRGLDFKEGSRIPSHHQRQFGAPTADSDSGRGPPRKPSGVYGKTLFSAPEQLLAAERASQI